MTNLDHIPQALSFSFLTFLLCFSPQNFVLTLIWHFPPPYIPSCEWLSHNEQIFHVSVIPPTEGSRWPFGSKPLFDPIKSYVRNKTMTMLLKWFSSNLCHTLNLVLGRRIPPKHCFPSSVIIVVCLGIPTEDKSTCVAVWHSSGLGRY